MEAKERVDAMRSAGFSRRTIAAILDVDESLVRDLSTDPEVTELPGGGGGGVGPAGTTSFVLREADPTPGSAYPPPVTDDITFTLDEDSLVRINARCHNTGGGTMYVHIDGVQQGYPTASGGTGWLVLNKGEIQVLATAPPTPDSGEMGSGVVIMLPAGEHTIGLAYQSATAEHRSLIVTPEPLAA